MSENPFVLVGGVPRSGTTLFQRMLDHHPEMAVTNDSHFIPRALEKYDRSTIEQVIANQTVPLTEPLVNEVIGYHRFHRLGLDAADVEWAATESSVYREFVANLYGRVAQKAGKRYAGEKTPDYIRRIEFLGKLLPQAKFFHLIRDGRNVALSMLSWAVRGKLKGPAKIALWNDSPIAVCALWWEWLIKEGERQATTIPFGNFFCVQYEQLVEEPEQTLEQVCAHLQLEFAFSMLECFRETGARPNRSAKSEWLKPKQGMRNWEHELGRDELELFECIAGKTLTKHGYPVVFSKFQPGIIERAEYYRNWWQKNFLEGQSSPYVLSSETRS